MSSMQHKYGLHITHPVPWSYSLSRRTNSSCIHPVLSLLFRDIAAPYQFGTVAFCLQSFCQILQVGVQIFMVRLRCHSIDSTGGVLIHVVPAFAQEVGVWKPVKVPKTMAFASFRSFCYPLQGGWLMFSRSDVSGISFLCRLRSSVRSFPMWLACPTSEYYA